MKLDILILAAHPDDVELCCAGTVCSHVSQGRKVGIVDFTKGEMGTRGTPEIRLQEAAASAKILGVSVRENLGFEDVFFENNKKHQLEVIKMIRKYQPEIVILNAIRDRHPDHGKASELGKIACFMSGLKKIETTLEGVEQTAWRPKAVYHYIQSNYIQPDFVVDISDFWEQKQQSIQAFKTQFFDPDSKEPETFISTPEFMKLIEARDREFGYSIGVKFAEGFTVERNLGIKNLFDLI